MSSSRRWHPRRDDEELAKKDDDLGLPKHAKQQQQQQHGGQWQAVHPPRRGLVLRLVVYLVVLGVLLFILIRTITAGDDASSPSPLDRDPFRHDFPGAYDSPTRGRPPPPPLDAEPKLRPKSNPVAESKTKPKTPAAGHDALDEPKSYNGPIKFYELAASLRAISSTGGTSVTNRNVLFAAASLKSAATLLPMACRMAYEKTTYVHFAFIGRSTISLKELLQVNGIDRTCPMMMHGTDEHSQRLCVCSGDGN